MRRYLPLIILLLAVIIAGTIWLWARNGAPQDTVDRGPVGQDYDATNEIMFVSSLFQHEDCIKTALGEERYNQLLLETGFTATEYPLVSSCFAR